MKPFLFLLIATNCVVSSLTTTAQTPVLLQTFNNPAPEGGDHFGIGLAALGGDRVLIGSPNYFGNPWPPTNAASVHLFHTNGTLLATITKPPGIMTEFGTSITTLGNDRIVIGSQNSYHMGLFTTNGTLVRIITNLFQPLGPSVVAIGSDKLLIGSPYAYPEPDPESWNTYGAAFLYDTNGTLLRTFYNPNPAAVSGFGWVVRAFGSDRVLIGSSRDWSGAGGVFLFHTNGTLLTTFTNPAPSFFDYFGRSVAAVGTDRVLVGSPSEGTDADEVYLFNTNGTLLLTIPNPTPATANDWFGNIAVLGNDRVVIGAPGDDTTGPGSGSAYVFNLDGTLLATINNPAPGIGDYFGVGLKTFGDDLVLIPAPYHNGVGSAYLFRVPAAPDTPSLTIQLTASNAVAISWPSNATGFVLQQNSNGVSSSNWSNVTDPVENDGTSRTLIINPGDGSRFFRLIRNPQSSAGGRSQQPGG